MSGSETAVFLQHPYAWSKASLELRDVQPLFGGVAAAGIVMPRLLALVDERF